MTQSRLTIRTDDKENLETAVLRLIQGINYDGIGNKQITPEQEKLRESYLRSYEALKSAENIGYEIKW